MGLEDGRKEQDETIRLILNAELGFKKSSNSFFFKYFLILVKSGNWEKECDS